jgi:hypothetical protein
MVFEPTPPYYAFIAVVSGRLGGLMSRIAVGVLAAAGAAMSAAVSLVHGDSEALMIAGAAGATGFAAYLAASDSSNPVRDDFKKITPHRKLSR